ncbi:unnamed protein product, partial [Ixodes persulcatus]
GDRIEFAVLVRGRGSTAEWLADLLRAQELTVECTAVRRETHHLLLIRLPPHTAPQAAEQVGLFKMHKDGYEKPFHRSNWRDFSHSEEPDPASLFSLAERQEIVQHLLYSIRATQLTEVVGVQPRRIPIYPGQSIFAVCQRARIIKAQFPPHDYANLYAIRSVWLSHLTIPVHMIRAYFGLRIAFYYAFLSFYTWSLMVPMVMGVLVHQHRDSLRWRVAGVLFNLFWNTIILEVWKRRAENLCCVWGLHETPPTRNRLLYSVEEHSALQKISRVMVSHVVVGLCVSLCVFQQYEYFCLESYVAIEFPSPSWGNKLVRVLPGVLNTLVAMAFSDVYRALSQRLTEWENHQTQGEYLRHLTGKLIVFDFFGRFGTLFYTAFYLQNVRLLRKQVYIQLVLAFTKDNLVEVAMPRAVREISALIRNLIRRDSSYLPGVHSILSEAEMTAYNSTYMDYYKMFSQFAFVFLFGPIVPLAPLVAFFGNLLEMLVVGYKLIVVFQRPLKVGFDGIGIWEPAFRAIGFLAVPSNIALLCVENPDPLSTLSRLFTDTEFVLFLVSLEHIILFLKLVLQYTLRSQTVCPHAYFRPVL